MPRGRGHRDNLMESGQELNIVPYLDIMVNLVMFMLFTITSFSAFTILNASIPQLAPDSATVKDPMKKAQLLLMVRVTKAGYDVDPSIQGAPSGKRSSVPKKGDQYDFDGLQAVAKDLKQQFPDESRVLIIAAPAVVYDDIIKTMDALRETKPGEKPDLFPDVTLSIL